MNVSLADLATDRKLDIVALIKAAKQHDFPSWITPKEAVELSDYVRRQYALSNDEMQQVHDFLLQSEKAKELLGKYARLEPLLTDGDSTTLLETIAQQLIRTMDASVKKRLTPAQLIVIMNLGVLEHYRTNAGGNDVGGVATAMAAILPEIGIKLLMRYHLNRMQNMDLEAAAAYVGSLRGTEQ